jgi:hypothetical protein
VEKLESKQLNAANAAIKEKSILSGHRIERSEIGQPGEFENLSDDELKHLLLERLIRLAPTLGITVGSSIALTNGNMVPMATRTRICDYSSHRPRCVQQPRRLVHSAPRHVSAAAFCARARIDLFKKHSEKTVHRVWCFRRKRYSRRALHIPAACTMM